MAGMANAPTLPSGLTQKQADFVGFRVLGIPQTEAARMAGYAFPDQDGYRLSRLPHVQAAIVREVRRAILTEDFQLARETIRQAMIRPDVPWGVKMTAAKLTLDAVHEFTREKTGDDKEMEDMTPAELVELIRQAEATAAGRARDITPGSAPDTARPVEPDAEPTA